MMKALILAGGKGNRLKPLTHTRPKQLLPVANRPILFYILDQIRQTGIDDIGIVISQDTGPQLKQAIGNGSRWGVKVSYILQPQPLGLAHAVKVSRDFLGDSPFLMFLGDNLIQGEITTFVELFNRNRLDAVVLLKKMPNPGAFGVAQLDSANRIVCIEEKPKQPKSDLVVVGIYVFSPAIHRAIEQIKPSARGELEITDSIQQLINNGGQVLSQKLEGWWLDTGSRDDLLEANRIMLEEFVSRKVLGRLDFKSSILGAVEIGEGTVVENSQINGPVSIGANCVIRNSFIKPLTSVGDNTIIEDSSVERSIILGDCRICSSQPLTGSVIGQGVKLNKAATKTGGLRLFVGDDAVLDL
jgi:glucose-1-phosphate thymidylyltransferase